MATFTTKKGLTKKLNMKGWEIYRDSEVGLYALNDELGIDHCLYLWNLTLDDPNLEKVIEMIRLELEKIEEEERGKEPFDPNKKLVVYKGWNNKRED